MLTCKPKHIGTYQGSLTDLCKLADQALVESGQYNLLTNNCQHFVNNFLARLGLKLSSTTVGPKVSISLTKEEMDFDSLSILLKN